MPELKEPPKVHKVSDNLWYVQCKKCGEWRRYKPDPTKPPSVFCEDHRQRLRNTYYAAQERQEAAKRISALS